MGKKKYKVGATAAYEPLIVGAVGAVTGAVAGKFITAKMRPDNYATAWADEKAEAYTKLGYFETPMGITGAKLALGIGAAALGAGLVTPIDDEMVSNGLIGFGFGLASGAVADYATYMTAKSEKDTAKQMLASIGGTTDNYMYIEEATPIVLRRNYDIGNSAGNSAAFDGLGG